MSAHLSAVQAQPQPRRFQRQSLRHCQLVAGPWFDVELVQDDRERQDDLVQRELASQAGTDSGSKWFVDVRRERADVVGQEPIGVEFGGVRPPRCVIPVGG